MDTDHARHMVTRKSIVGGILLLMNNTSISWVSNCQITMESAACGSVMVTTRISVEQIISIKNMDISGLNCT